MTIVLKDRAGEHIHNWQSWTRPKQMYHWQEGRSAMELARAWFTLGTPQCPPELQALLATNTRTAPIHIDEGRPEFVTGLPERGEGRNHDLLLRGRIGSEAAIVCVEAKGDELFGRTIGDYWQQAKASQKTTRVPERIQALLEIVFGASARPNQPPWCDLRYQLLTGIAGTLIQATKEHVPIGIFIVHEFQTALAEPKLMQANAEDYARFVALLFSVPTIRTGQMYGPLSFPSHRYLAHPVEFFTGKATCEAR